MASGIKKIGAGVHYSALLLENGDLYFSGRQTYAEGYFEDYHSFVKIKQNINDIYCGQNDFLTVTSNEDGGSTVEAICHRTSFSFASPVTAGCVYSDHALLRSDGRWYAAGDNSSGQCGVTGSETLSEFTLVDGTDDWLAGRLTAAAVGKAHSVALKADGNVVVWGSNQYGQLGVPEEFSTLPAPAGSPYLSTYSGSTIEDAQSLFDLKTPDVETDTLGYTIADIDTPLYLQLENGVADTFLFEAAPETNGLSLNLSLLNADGQLIRSFTESTEVVLLDDTTYYLCVRSVDRHRCGGFMIRYNRLGLRGISFDTALPLQAGEQQLSVYQGKNLYVSFTAEHTGSYFITTEDEQALSCTLFDGERRQLQTFVCSGQIALSTGQTVYLMITNPRPNAFSTLRVFLSTPDTRTKQVAAGQNFSLIVREDGTVLGCGHNAFGQLGIGKKQTRQAECKAAAIIGVQKVDCGERHAVALKEDGSIWTWGANDKYQLGMDGTESQPIPRQITALGTDNIDVIAQLHGGIALKQDGSLVGWGRNYYGELGTGSAQPIIQPVALPMPDGVQSIAQIGSGTRYTALLTQDGKLYLAGTGAGSNLGLIQAAGNDRFCFQEYITDVPIDNMICGNERIILLSNGQVISGGPEGLNAIRGGDWYDGHGVVFNDSGVLYAFGQNGAGQLGDGTTTNAALTQVADPVDWLTFSQAAVGGTHTIALKPDGSVWTWGSNQYGQLGIAEPSSSSIPVKLLDACPDDYANHPEQAHPVEWPEWPASSCYPGTIDFTGDRDWFVFTPPVNGKYRLALSCEAVSGTLSLYEPGETGLLLLASGTAVEYELDHTKTYYYCVTDKNTGSYEVQLLVPSSDKIVVACQKDTTIRIYMSINGSPAWYSGSFELCYDPALLCVTDLSVPCYGKQTQPGAYQTVNIHEVEDGRIRFELPWLRTITGQYQGLANIFEFTALNDGAAQISIQADYRQ